MTSPDDAVTPSRSSMLIAYTPDQEKFRDEVLAYFGPLLTPDVRRAFATMDEAEGSGYRDVIRQLGRDGWLAVSWPPEYGGRGLSPVESYILADETRRLGVMLPILTTHTVGPALIRYGTAQQRARFLPPIAAGETLFSIGYSEPEAGTDLAALTTRAVRSGDHYAVNGQKIWTSLIHHADYVWLAVRTDPSAPRHRGISILIVATDSEGFSWTPIHTLRGGFTSATYYQDVRVPVGHRVGAENQGWEIITAQLNDERVAISPAGVVTGKLDQVLAWARATRLADGRRVVDLQWVQLNLARVQAQLEVLKLANWKLAAGAPGEPTNPVDASALKVYGSTCYVECCRLLMEVVGGDAVLADGSPGAVLADSLEAAMRWNLVTTFAGGTNEVQREIIARAGLGLTRAVET
jgi:alkylation response protein AidB-like acyl-CoA dehydrogenase